MKRGEREPRTRVGVSDDDKAVVLDSNGGDGIDPDTLERGQGRGRGPCPVCVRVGNGGSGDVERVWAIRVRLQHSRGICDLLVRVHERLQVPATADWDEDERGRGRRTQATLEGAQRQTRTIRRASIGVRIRSHAHGGIVSSLLSIQPAHFILFCDCNPLL
jgi:hypothetical protein